MALLVVDRYMSTMVEIFSVVSSSVVGLVDMLLVVGKSFVVFSFVVGVVTDPSVAVLGDTVVHVVDAVKISFITLVVLKARHLGLGRFYLSRQWDGCPFRFWIGIRSKKINFSVC